MKAIRSSSALKIAAFVLLVASALAAAGSGAMLLYGYDQGFYGEQIWYEDGVRKQSDGTFYTTESCRYLADMTANDLCEDYQTNRAGLREMHTGEYYSYDFQLRLGDAKGKVLVSTLQPGADYGMRAHVTMEFPQSPDDAAPDGAEEPTAVLPSEDGAVVQPDKIYAEVAVTKPLRGTDRFYEQEKLFRLCRRVQPALVPLLVCGSVLALISLIFLCCAAGHRRGKEGIFLSRGNKIPFDLYAFVLVGVAVVCGDNLSFGYYGGYGRYDLLQNALCIGAAVLGFILLGTLLLLSFVTRVKAGLWWRNTIIYRGGAWLLRNGRRLLAALGRGLHALPLIWRTAIIAPAVILMDIFLVCMGQWDGAAAFFCFLFNLAVLTVILLAALQMRALQKGGQELAKGNSEYKIGTKRMLWDFKKHGENLNAIADGMGIAVERQLRSERLKTELITNVSHDIKTPLTSIVNYVDLLQKTHTEQEQVQYLDVLQRQSARLKKLTEDLVEASKASTGNVATNLTRTNVAEIVNQSLGEYAERLTAGNLTVVTDLPEGEVAVMADGRLLWRILDNLLSNVCKYAMAGTRVYVSVRREDETIIAVKNISRLPLNVTAEELQERFVRGDTARSTEGSGLGLNIARSLTQLQGGKFSLYVDGDFFRAELKFPNLG